MPPPTIFSSKCNLPSHSAQTTSSADLAAPLILLSPNSTPYRYSTPQVWLYQACLTLLSPTSPKSLPELEAQSTSA